MSLRTSPLLCLLGSAAMLAAVACGDVTPFNGDAGPDADNGGADGDVNDPDASAPDAMPDPVDPAVVAVDRKSNNFGNVLRNGRSATARFLVRNTGEGTSGELNTSVSGSASEFELDDSCDGDTLDSGATCELLVTFTPGSIGDAAATVTIESEPGGSISIALTGVGLMPGALAIDDEEHDFGTIAVAKMSAGKSFVIENTGDVDTGVITATLSDEDAFEISSDDCSGSALAAHTSCTIDVRFGPGAVGTATASLTISATPGGNTIAALGGNGNARITVAATGTGGGRVLSTPAGIDCGSTCNADFDTPAVTLKATANASSVFKGWGGDCTGGGDCEIELDGSASVQARFEAIRHLEVERTGAGVGDVTSVPAGINCGADCDGDYEHGTRVTLTASAGANSRFLKWNDCPEPSGPTCVVPMTRAVKVFANFGLVSRALTVTSKGNGNVRSVPTGISCGNSAGACIRSYTHGTSVVLTATAGTGSDFGSWLDCPSVGPSANTCTVHMDAVRTVGAVYKLETRTLNTSTTGAGSGTLTPTPAGTSCGAGCRSYGFGTPLTLRAAAGANSVFGGWSDSCDGPSGTSCTMTMNENKTVSARFDIIQRELSIKTANGRVTSNPVGITCGNGATSCAADFNEGSGVVLTAVPVSGYRFSGWNNCVIISRMSCRVTMSGDQTVTAGFARIRHTLTVNPNANGLVEAADAREISCGTNCTQNYNEGTNVTLRGTAKAGFFLSGWTGCSDVSTKNVCTVEMTQDRNVTPIFRPRYFIDVKTSGGGTVTSVPGGINCLPTCSAEFDEGEAVVLTATASTGFRFVSWDKCDDVQDNKCTVKLSAGRVVVPVFEPIQYTMTVPYSARGYVFTQDTQALSCGNGSTKCSVTYSPGADVTVQAKPSGGYYVSGWKGCDKFLRNTCTLTMNSDRTPAPTLSPIQTISYLLTVNRTGTGKGSVTPSSGTFTCSATSCTASYVSGTSVTLTAKARQFVSTFEGWKGCTANALNPRQCTVSMSQARNVEANFKASGIGF